MEYLIEEVLKATGESREQFDKEVEALKYASPVLALQLENEQLKKRLESAEEALLFLMDMGMI